MKKPSTIAINLDLLKETIEFLNEIIALGNWDAPIHDPRGVPILKRLEKELREKTTETPEE